MRIIPVWANLNACLGQVIAQTKVLKKREEEEKKTTGSWVHVENSIRPI